MGHYYKIKSKVIGIDKGKETQVKGTENILKVIIEQNFPNPRKEMPIKIQETNRTPNRLDQKRKSRHHIIIKTLKILKKERILKAPREKDQVT